MVFFCDSCECWLHYKCENLTSVEVERLTHSDGYGTFRAKTNSSLGRFDRDDSRKKSNGTLRARKLGRFAQNQNLEVDSPIFINIFI